MRMPLSIYVAKGHGRSYGMESTFFGKKIPGIFQCGIWQALDEQKKLPTAAWVSDIGNDLAYEVPVEKIIQWVFGCVDRLLALNARVVLSDLPIDVLRTVGESRFRLFRAMFFPGCRLDWQELLHRAEQLSQRLYELARERKTPVFSVPNAWYGFDPIHPRRIHLVPLWRSLLDAGGVNVSETTFTNKTRAMDWYLRSLRPECWSTFSFCRRANQPNGRLHDGTEIALY